MAKLKKPEFSRGEGGWVDPDFFPNDLKIELFEHLNASPLNQDQKHALITFASQMAQFGLCDEAISAQTQRNQIEKVAKDARRLLASINLLSESTKDVLQAHTDYLAFGSNPPVQIQEQIKEVIRQPEGSLLSLVWDFVEALESSSEYAIEQFNIDTTSKPLLMRARGYVSMLAQRIHAMTGKTPPKSNASWFAAFVTRLGEHLGLPIGPRVVISGIEDTLLDKESPTT